MATTEYQIVIVDSNTKKWPKAADLLKVGVPIAVANRYKRVRREFTAGLKRRLRGELRN